VHAIQLIGFSKKVEDALRIALTNRCRQRFCVARDQGDFLLIDLEGVGNIDKVGRIANKGERPTIVLSEPSAPALSELRLHKPLVFSKLVSLLEELAAPGDTRSCHGKTTRNQNNSKAQLVLTAKSTLPSKEKPPQAVGSLSVHTSPQRATLEGSFAMFLTQLLVRIRSARDDRSIEVTIKPNKYLRIDPLSERVSTNLTASSLRVLAITPCSTLRPDVKHVELSARMDDPRSDAPRDLEELIWRVLEVGYRNSLLDPLELEEPVRLKTWPNLIRLTTSSSLFALMSYWTKRPASIRELTHMFDLGVEEIVHVANFAYLAGLLDHKTAHKVSEPGLHVPPIGMRRILRRILYSVSKQAA
jgi:hypothetical protein